MHSCCTLGGLAWDWAGQREDARRCPLYSPSVFSTKCPGLPGSTHRGGCMLLLGWVFLCFHFLSSRLSLSCSHLFSIELYEYGTSYRQGVGGEEGEGRKKEWHGRGIETPPCKIIPFSEKRWGRMLMVLHSPRAVLHLQHRAQGWLLNFQPCSPAGRGWFSVSRCFCPPSNSVLSLLFLGLRQSCWERREGGGGRDRGGERG